MPLATRVRLSHHLRRPLCFAALLTSVAACHDGTAPEPLPDAATITLDRDQAEVLTGDSLRLHALAVDSGGRTLPAERVHWYSSNAAVATVDADGLLRATGPGTAVITAGSGLTRAAAVITIRIAFRSLATAAGRYWFEGATMCGIARSGQTYCWGRNVSGEAGVGAADDGAHTHPRLVAGGHEFRALAAGLGSHVCGLTLLGAAFCWGANDAGQLGDGTTTMRPAPTPVRGGLAFSALATGRQFTCGLVSDGLAYCWGDNASGQLGRVTGDCAVAASCALLPAPVSGAQRFVAVAAGAQHACGLDAQGAAYCWGANAAGQLGDGTTTPRAAPARVAATTPFQAIAADSAHSCALTRDGRVYCWGSNASGELGVSGVGSSATPVEVPGTATFTAVAAGDQHSCALDDAGVAACWGYNAFSQLGHAGVAPAPVDTPLRFDAIVAGAWSTCALTHEGVAYCWGENSLGALGGAAVERTATPVRVEDPR